MINYAIHLPRHEGRCIASIPERCIIREAANPEEALANVMLAESEVLEKLQSSGLPLPPSVDRIKSRKSELYFEEIGTQFDDWMSLYDVRQRIDLIKQFIPINVSEMSCLEVGCGTGKISEAIISLVKRLTVSDLSEKLSEEVGIRLKVNWTPQDACNLSFPDNTFDIVISSECIEHTPNPKQALVEMARVVRNNGTIIITSPNKIWYPILLLSVITKIRKFRGNEIWLFPWEAADVLKKHDIADIQFGGCHLFPWQIPVARYILPLFDRLNKLLYPVMINYGICGKKRISIKNM